MNTTLPGSTLGRTGLQVSKLGYGAMEVRGPRIWGGRPVEDLEAETILNAVVDAGITLWRSATSRSRTANVISSSPAWTR